MTGQARSDPGSGPVVIRKSWWGTCQARESQIRGSGISIDRCSFDRDWLQTLVSTPRSSRSNEVLQKDQGLSRQSRYRILTLSCRGQDNNLLCQCNDNGIHATISWLLVVGTREHCSTAGQRPSFHKSQRTITQAGNLRCYIRSPSQILQLSLTVQPTIILLRLATETFLFMRTPPSHSLPVLLDASPVPSLRAILI